MTNPLTQALRSQIDQRVADYVDSAIRDAIDLITNDLTLIHSLISQSQATEIHLANRLTEIENAPTTDDKYALTKSKLIRLMKDMGYTD